eukprot:205498_1
MVHDRVLNLTDAVWYSNVTFNIKSISEPMNESCSFFFIFFYLIVFNSMSHASCWCVLTAQKAELQGINHDNILPEDTTDVNIVCDCKNAVKFISQNMDCP